jgi:hypothetical protein
MNLQTEEHSPIEQTHHKSQKGNTTLLGDCPHSLSTTSNIMDDIDFFSLDFKNTPMLENSRAHMKQ